MYLLLNSIIRCTWVLSPRNGASSRWGCGRRPPNIEDVHRISNCGQLGHGWTGGCWGSEDPAIRRRKSQHVTKRQARPCTSSGPLEIGEKNNSYRTLVGKSEGKRPSGRPRCRLEDSIKIDLREIRNRAWAGLIWFGRGTGSGILRTG
jgi:hypothetical protein